MKLYGVVLFTVLSNLFAVAVPLPHTMDRSDVLIAVPTNGLTVSGQVNVAGDIPSSATSTSLFADGQLVPDACTTSSRVFSCVWTSTRGKHDLKVTAADANGHSWESGVVTVYGRQLFNIRTYGALPDRLDNLGPIQDALDAAATAGGGTVFIPAGIYRVRPSWPPQEGVTSFLTIGSNTEVRGELAPDGSPAAILQIPGDNGNFQTLFNDTQGGLSNISFVDFKVDVVRYLYPYAPSPLNPTRIFSESAHQSAFTLKGTNTNVVFDRVTIVEAGFWAIRINGDGLIINECHTDFQPGLWLPPPPNLQEPYDHTVFAIHDYSSLYPDGQHVLVRNNTVTTTNPEFPGTGIESAAGGDDPYNIIVEGNTVNGTNAGLIIQDSLTFPVERQNNYWVDGNIFERNQGYGISFLSYSWCRAHVIPKGSLCLTQVHAEEQGILKNVHLQNNAVFAAPEGGGGTFFVAAGPDPVSQAPTDGEFSDIFINNNVFDFSPVFVHSYKAASGISIVMSNTATNVTVTGNTIKNAPAAGLELASATFETADSNTFSNNTIINAGWDTCVSPNRRAGISINAARFTGPTTMDSNTIQDAGTGLYSVWAFPVVPPEVPHILLTNTQIAAPSLLYCIDRTVIDDDPPHPIMCSAPPQSPAFCPAPVP